MIITSEYESNQLKARAREYAEQYLPLSDPDLTKSDRDDMVNTMADYAEEIFQWLANTHLIVNKENVRSLYNEIFFDIMDAHSKEDCRSLAHYALDVLPRDFQKYFGNDIFDAKEVVK